MYYNGYACLCYLPQRKEKQRFRREEILFEKKGESFCKYK